MTRLLNERKKDQLLGLIIVLAAFIAYVNSLGNGFVWDDSNVIVTNPALRGSALSLFSSIDTSRDYELLPYYRPLTILTFLIEERVHGLVPFPMHLVNVLFHSVNAFLVYCLARSLMNDKFAALLAGLLFAVHPLNTETVDFISGGRNTMLACFFILTAYLLHRRSILRSSYLWAFSGALSLLAGLFSKEAALVSLLFIIALELQSLRENVSALRSQAALRLLPYVAAATCYLIMRWHILSDLGIQTGIIPGFGAQKLQGFYKIPDLWSRLADNVYIIPRYLLTVFWPVALNPRYIIPESLQSVVLPLGVAWTVIIATLGWLLTRGRSRVTLFGLCWLIAFYLPVSGIAIFPSAPMADRYMYLPAIGLWMVVADQSVRCLVRLSPALRRRMIAAAMIVTLSFMGLTVRRNMDWENDIALFSRVVNQYPDNAYGHAGLGEAYFIRDRLSGDFALAGQEFERTLALSPKLPGVHTKMGYIQLAGGNSEGALYYYTLALGIYPLDKEALLNRAIAFENLGRQKEALTDFKRFLSLKGYELADARPYAEARVLELSK
ncbi:MAG: glycosyltransferase family 39 protein [Nitrospirae bacterium]|nr:glycosyltransferase family 39 protein [Nitrospirota bacterium]